MRYSFCRTSVLSERMVQVHDMAAAREAEQEVLRAVQDCGYSEASAFAIRLALEEGLNNAIRHGNRLDTSKTVKLEADVDARRVMIMITDEGAGFDPETVPDPTIDENLEKPSGRGIMLMRAYMDEVTYSPKGNSVTMVKHNTA